MSTIMDMNNVMSSCWGDEATGYVMPAHYDTRAITVSPVVTFNKLAWGIPLERVVEIPEDGEDLVKYMNHCSNKMMIIAKEREKFKDEPKAVEYIKYLAARTRDWTKMRSTYAQHYLDSDFAVSKDMRILDLQTSMDAAKMNLAWDDYNTMLPEIESLRNERARFEKWARDNEKLD